MSWFACHRSEELLEMIRKDPKAFSLFSLIAARARYHEEPCQVTGLRYGQAFIGDFREAGLKTRQEYRNSLKRLFDRRFLTIQGTNKGTIVTILPNPIYSVSITSKEPPEKPSKNQQGTIQQPLTTRKQGIEGNKEDILPSGSSRLTQAQKGRKKVHFNTPEMIRIGSWFKQKPTTLWTISEYLALQDVEPTEEDMNLIEEHYSYEIENNGYRFKAIETLLNNWPAARAKANAFFQENPTLGI